MISTRTATLTILLWTLSLPPWSHAADVSPNATFRAIRKIAATEGVELQETVTIGGVPQWISIRSRDRSAPILLVLHGGPGFTLSPVSDYYMRDWEEFFTVVQWDQRGAGKSYRREARESLAPTLTIDQLVRDTEAMIELLRKRFKQERVVLLAHSFGTIVGVKLAQRRPDLLHAYVGMGQFVDAMRSEALGYEATLADARAEKNSEAITQLEAIAPFPDPAHPERNLQNLPTERRWLAHYGGYFHAGGEGHHYAVAQLSPTHTAADLQARQEAHDFIVATMWKAIGAVDLSDDLQFRVPIIIMQGRYDRGTSSQLVNEWHAAVAAPVKKLIWFENSSHMVYEEEPGKMLVSLVNEVLPLTRSK
ncbi:MAG: alpha/beta hydrolase [Pseudomonadota bacterium]|nr:alpha/beta hydrolase [Pseudomonadota bacterium]